jgi:hypothetical protein
LFKVCLKGKEMIKKIGFWHPLVWAVCSLVTLTGYSQNLLNNGDFELGYNVGYQGGQSPNYTYISFPFSGTTNAGNWTIYTQTQPVNTTSFITTTDHSGGGNMMIVDGTGVGGQQRFWKAGTNGSGICGLTVGATYTFSYWIRSIFTTPGGTLANIGIQFNNATATLVSGSVIAPTVANGSVSYTHLRAHETG